MRVADRPSSVELVRSLLGSRAGETDAPLVRAAVEYLDERDDRLTVAGWMHTPGGSIDAFQFDVDGEVLVATKPVRRPDVEKGHGWCPPEEFRGFVATVSLPPTRFAAWCTIDVVGSRAGVPVGRLRFRYRTGFRDGIPTPPPHLTSRTTNLESPEAYWAGALHMSGEYVAALVKHTGSRDVRRFLDWGCGCGRLTSLFLNNTAIPEIHGCDIDGETVAWCIANLPRGRFLKIPPHPPTPYADGSFDAIISYSVFTHLGRDVQIEWLGEMRRVLVPGGLFLASVHGDFAAALSPEQQVRADLESSGFSDRLPDSKLDGIAPEGYYRCVYQTKAWTLREWSKHFEVLEYAEGVVGNFQDLVVLRKGSA
jgi:SAM-dependent methyltransferase